MAFGFLSDVGNIVQGAAGIASLFGDRDEPEANQQASRAINEAIKLAKASANPNSRAFKNLVALEEESNRLSAIKAIQDFLKQNQRNIARGGISGVVNPERRDESVMKALARSFVDARERARIQARNTLSNAASSLTGSGQALNPVANIQNQISTTNDKRRADLGQAIGAGISSLDGLFDRGYAPTTVSDMGSERGRQSGVAGSTRIELA